LSARVGQQVVELTS